LAKFLKIIEVFTQKKIVTKLSKIWVRDPGSGKNLFQIPDPGVKKAPDPGSGSATLKKRIVGLRFQLISSFLKFFPLNTKKSKKGEIGQEYGTVRYLSKVISLFLIRSLRQ
jgi:hypothetical protein